MQRIFILSLLIFSSVYSYNYYLFASIWAPTDCYFTQCWANQTGDINREFFNIHGLWPNNWEGYPQFCDNNTEFNPNYLNPTLLNTMEHLWNGMNWTTNDFHAHEWPKHGTCWNDPAGFNNEEPQKQEDFFFTVIALAGQINIYRVLANFGVTPSNTAYPVQLFTDAFNQTWGNGTYLLNCEEDQNEDQYLFSVYICINLQYQIMNCPANLVSNFNDLCPWNSSVYYKPMTTNVQVEQEDFTFQQ